MGKEALERKLAMLDELRANPAGAVDELRKTLKDRNGFLVSKAAVIAAGVPSLVDDIAAAFDRFLSDAKSDPQCLAKVAIAKALKDQNYDDSRLYLRGLRHIQLEKTFGGSVDTAGTLRGTCALALIGCPLPRFEILESLVDLLAGDSLKPVRIDAARAIAQLAGPDSILLLRLKAMGGDAEPEVVGQCFLGLLDLSASDYIPFVAGFLERRNLDLRLEAAVALGECAREEAVEVLARTWRKIDDRELRRAISVSLGGSKLESAAAFLFSIVVEGRSEDASDALRALSTGRFAEEYRERIERATS